MAVPTRSNNRGLVVHYSTLGNSCKRSMGGIELMMMRRRGSDSPEGRFHSSRSILQGDFFFILLSSDPQLFTIIFQNSKFCPSLSSSIIHQKTPCAQVTVHSFPFIALRLWHGLFFSWVKERKMKIIMSLIPTD